MGDFGSQRGAIVSNGDQLGLPCTPERPPQWTTWSRKRSTDWDLGLPDVSESGVPTFRGASGSRAVDLVIWLPQIAEMPLVQFAGGLRGTFSANVARLEEIAWAP
jgi:hypothetical protein